MTGEGHDLEIKHHPDREPQTWSPREAPWRPDPLLPQPLPSPHLQTQQKTARSM